jgi:predicted amidohydrolase YtcJ
MALANSEALRRAGIDETTPTPTGGEIVRGADGRPTGVLKDEAMQLVERVIPAQSEAQVMAAFERAQEYALANGVTQIHDMAMSTAPGLTLIEAYRKAHSSGLMKIRVSVFSPLTSWNELAEYIAANGEGDDTLRWNSVKGFVDGALGSTTAWFYEPFTDHPETSGFALGDTEKLKADIRAADAAGLRVAVHAIGDRANDWLLGVYEEIGGGDVREKRFRVEHAQHLTRGAIDDFARLGVIASIQPYHAVDDGRWAEKRIGPERIKTTYAFRSLLDAGAILSFGSDWTVAPMNVVQGFDAAMFRRTLDGANPDGWVPAEKITAEEALEAYTVTNAYAGFQEDKLGTIEAGKLADIVVLSADPTTADETTIGDIKVVRTIVGGKTVFSLGD